MPESKVTVDFDDCVPVYYGSLKAGDWFLSNGNLVVKLDRFEGLTVQSKEINKYNNDYLVKPMNVDITAYYTGKKDA